MIDAPCGSMVWMPYLLTNLSVKYDKKFRFYGVDIVESIINASIIHFANYTDPNVSLNSTEPKIYKNYSDQWKFSVLDFTSQNLPDNYELIFTRDALMHLPFKKIVGALRVFASVKGAKYLLAGSYVKSGYPNRNINIGEWFEIDLLKPPFNLKNYTELFNEVHDNKHLILYDIPNYLSKIDFDKLLVDCEKHVP